MTKLTKSNIIECPLNEYYDLTQPQYDKARELGLISDYERNFRKFNVMAQADNGDLYILCVDSGDYKLLFTAEEINKRLLDGICE